MRKDSPEKDEIKIYEKTPKRILILIGKIISVVGLFFAAYWELFIFVLKNILNMDFIICF